MKAIDAGKAVMVNVEGDACSLRRQARLSRRAWFIPWPGEHQSALIAEHVDWARTCGFKVVSAGKGTPLPPDLYKSNLDTVWDIPRQDLNITDRAHINPKMFNSFIDGTNRYRDERRVQRHRPRKPKPTASSFPQPPASARRDLRLRSQGGVLEKSGVTEVISSVTRDEQDVPHHLAMGTYVVIESDSDYARQCFVEYNMLPDGSGCYASLYRLTHMMIGRSLAYPVASAALRKELTWSPSVSILTSCRNRQGD
ncbi:MAG: hypothetical protein R3D67_22490 [Hyphomicrobiaceae bacterium]